MVIGKVIKKLRIEQGLTQASLSNLANVSQSVISGTENCTREPTIDVLSRICKVFGLSLSGFFLIVEGRDEEAQKMYSLTADEEYFIRKLRLCDPEIRIRAMTACLAFIGCSPDNEKLPSCRNGSQQNGTINRSSLLDHAK